MWWVGGMVVALIRNGLLGEMRFLDIAKKNKLTPLNFKF